MKFKLRLDMSMINKTTIEKNIITEEIMKDLRLFPLFCNNTKLLLQLFVVKIKNNNNDKKTYEIVYGLCTRTTREEISNEIFCSDFQKIYTSDNKTYYIAKISTYNYPPIIVGLVNELLLGQSLKCAIKDKLMDRRMNFDVYYTNFFNIRPVIFNEKNASISLNPYAKVALISPYKDVSSFTLTICNLDKTNIISRDEDLDNSALLEILKYLEIETSFPFLRSSCVRFGNIDFFNTQCADEYEVGYVNIETIKENVKIDYEEESICRKLAVSIIPNIYTCSKRLFINCVFKNGEQVILDECKEIFHEDKQKITLFFESQEQIGSISISIWKEESGILKIWYRYSVNLCRQISFNIGVVELHGVVKSEWLNTIERSNSKAKTKIAEAEKISKISYQRPTSIGKYTLDPWVKADSDFLRYINQINPEKSEAEFFPQGWSNETNEYGSLSFLEWFKKQTEDAQRVVIQDPFYDTLGLEFFVRATNAKTDFTVLTCTQVRSADDDKILEKGSEPNRASRIRSFISSNPTLSDSLKLSIYDLRSMEGGNTNLLHDRYMLIFNEDRLKKGFHLSNSIQGATKKQPLLITPIPQDVLQKVDKHLSDLINKISTKENLFEIIPLYDYRNNILRTEVTNEIQNVSNEKLYKQLMHEFRTENIVSKKVVEDLIMEALAKKQFPDFWATFCLALANANCSKQVVSILEKIDNLDFSIPLREYLESSITEKYLLGFSKESKGIRNDFRFLFIDNFRDIVKKTLRLENYIPETYAYGNWSIWYGCNLLLNINFAESVKLVRFIKDQYNKDSKNVQLSKLSTVLFTQLLNLLFYRNKTDDLIEKLLTSNISCLKAIASSVLIADILKDKPSLSFDDTKKLLLTNLSNDESLSVFVCCLLNHKFIRKHIDSALESDIFSAIFLILYENYTNDRLQNILRQILYSYYPSVEKKLTEKVLCKLEEAKLIEANDIFKLWSDEFLTLLDNFEYTCNYRGLVDVVGWSSQIVSHEIKQGFVEKLQKRFLKELNEIRRPFRQDTEQWNKSFDHILLIKIVLMITVLYAEDKKNCDDEIQLVREIDKLETDYQYNKSTEICTFLCYIEEKYTSNPIVKMFLDN